MPPKKAAPKAAPKKAAPTAAAAKQPAAKRARSDTAAPAAKVAKAAAWATASARPPVDEHCSNFQGSVCLDTQIATPWAVKLNQTNIGHNNNKFYIIQLIEGGSRFACFTRWGRVGETGQSALDTGDRASMEKAFEKKFKDKTKNDWKVVKGNSSAFTNAPGKYDLVETDSSASTAPAVVAVPGGKPVIVKASKLKPKLQSVLSLIFDRDMFKAKMKEQNIDANRMPLGKLTKAQVERGYDALAEVEKVVKKAKQTPKDREELQQLSSRFYTVIPHDFGRVVPPVIDTTEMVKTKYDLLDMLNDIQIAMAMDETVSTKSLEESPIDSQYKELGCKLEVVEPGSDEFKMIDLYTNVTQGYSRCSARNVFRVDRPQDKDRMQKGHGKEKEGRYLLWHGTNIAVVAAILKTGLRIMPHAGGRVGKGLYFASENGKSSAYTRCHNRTGMMFLVEVCMGDKIHRIAKDDSTLNLGKVNGLKATSVLACGRQEPDHSKDKTVKGEWGPIAVPQSTAVSDPKYAQSSFSQSEYLVYEESRVRIKYMIEMEFK